jgi:cyclophilin family peptidyl-prolyl cis-trans isomerase
MPHRLCLALVVAALVSFAAAAPSANGQVVRFQTTLGNFDMVLNPTNNPLLQGHVNNMLAYVDEQTYRGSWITRAAEGQNGEDFVLQMGGFFSHTKRPSPTLASTRRVVTFNPVTGAPAAELGLSNTVGTVSLALPSDANGALPDAGTNQFFINMKDNSFLDPDFTVFAAISDMTVINEIMALSTFDRTTDDQFPDEDGNANFQEVPITADGKQVFIRRAFVLNDSLSIALARSNVMATMALSAANSGSGANSSAFALSSNVVPEPATATLLLVALVALPIRRRR